MPKGYSRTHIKNRIAFFRERRGMTQQQLSDLIHRKKGALASWESGHCNPPSEMRPILARLLRTTEAELFPNG